MAKTAYIGVDGVARKVKQPYVGVDGVARKVKSGYVGVDGVARQFYSGELVLFDANANGDNTAVTGGWTVLGRWGRSDSTLTVTGTTFKVYLPNKSSYGTIAIATVNSIDISSYSTMHIEGKWTRSSSSNYNENSLGFYKGSITGWNNLNDMSTRANNGASGSFSLSTTITLSGKQRPSAGFCEGWGGVESTFTITKIWLE